MAKSQDYIVRLKADNTDLKRKLADTRKRMRSHTTKMQGFAKQAAGHFAIMFGGAAIGQAIVSSVKKIAEFEFQMDKVAAVSGASADEVKRLTNNALELGAKSKFTATEIGKLQEELARLGFTTDQIVGMTDAARKLATVADTELGPTAKALGKTMNAFGLETKDTGRIANTMAESFSKSALDLEQFEAAMANVGTAAKISGFSLEETTAMLGKLVDNGIVASKAGTDLRKIFTELSLKGLTLDEALDQIATSTNKVSTAEGLFGDRAFQAAVILQEQRGEVDKLTDSLSDNNKELNKMVGIMEDNLLTDFRLLTSAFDGLIQKGGALNPILRDMTQSLTKMVNLISKMDFKQFVAVGAMFGAGGIGAAKNMVDAFDAINKMNTRNATPDGPKSLLQPILDVLPPINEELTETVKKVDSLSMSLSKLSSLGLDTKQFEDIFKKLEFKGKDIIPLQGVGEDNPILSRLRETFEATKMESQMQMDEINGILEGGLESGIAAFADGLATGGIEQAFEQLFSVIGGGLQNLGKALIAQGVALKAAISLGPVAKIAAGVAAVAAGALIKKASSGLSASYASSSMAGGGGGGGSRGMSNISSQMVNVNINGKLSADTREIYAVLENEGNRQKRVRDIG